MRLAVALLVLAVVLAGAGIHLASTAPDGLERAAHELGVRAPQADPARRSRLRESLIALCGVGAALAAVRGVGALLVRRRGDGPPG
jgi:hypothetical protein